MKKQYKNWLIANGYKMFTPAPNYFPSTAYDYLRGVNRVCEYENLSIEGVAKKIDVLLPKYEPSGEMSRSVRCGLRNFARFIKEQKVA